MPFNRSCCLCDVKPCETLHKFPKDNNLCLLWKQICGLGTTRDVTNMSICYRHFLPSDYQFNVWKFGGKLRLMQGRYPTVNVPNRAATVCTIHPSEKRKFTTTDLTTPKKANHYLKLAKQTHRLEKLKARALRKRNTRLLDKITVLEEKLIDVWRNLILLKEC